MPATPSSETSSIYFDAPLIPFNMSAAPQEFIQGEGADEQPITTGKGGKALHPNGSEGWLPAAELPPEHVSPTHTGPILRNAEDAPSIGTSTSSVPKNTLNRGASVNRTASVSKRSVFTNADGNPIAGSAFIGGAATTGPNAKAEPDESLYYRAAEADASLSAKQLSKIQKTEAKDSKRLSKIIKAEGKVEKRALGVAIQELSELQNVQKAAVKRESQAHTAHARALAALQKNEAAFLAARTKYEIAQAQLHAEAETLEISRNNAREATEHMQEKSQEVDGLRTMFGIDEREREVKLVELTPKKSKHAWKW
ncbi:uncharacterized protein EV420DRAFT_1634123 [Desarmillaria tabescens]|uniref:DNA binding protein Ncp1 n=1 Tax=Armillaria tabescens TaxID=1929756 RepID=A0AA39NQ06_ARMTA|nr:uncharacterized protein EV420DRAFT_1634123 [Desarmillaria tabescens]KAK0469705.1 hypothetical protein EV420DRAFT_1634123 [Desarmillaria tabescens]